MRKKVYWKNRHGYLWRAMLILITLCFTSCKDDDDQAAGAGVFDPNKPVIITGFTPESLGGGEDIVLYGNNFGNDISKIKVSLGGKNATVIGVNNHSIYCFMPMGAFDGDIQVSILDDDGEVIAIAEPEKKYTYKRQWLVSNCVGTYYNVGSDYEEKEGPFGDCGAFKDILWFSWDPKSNFDRLYFTGNYNRCRLIDFSVDNGPDKEKGYVYYFTSADQFDRVSVMTWTIDENQDMILTHNHSSDSKIGNYLFTRSSNFTEQTPLGIYARGVNGTMVHPETNELYYTRYRGGDMYKYNFDTQETTFVFAFAYATEAYRLVIHPTGKYAYIIGNERDFILRTDYNYVTNTFTTPYTVVGQANSPGYQDGVGSFVRVNAPSQGVFVKNKDYIGTRPDGDEYDFYFCDADNHCIRILTPDGKVSTFAGRGNGKTSGYQNGEVRTDALFNYPRAIAYDEKRNCFYVGDTNNWIIRKIAQENEDDYDDISDDEEDNNTEEAALEKEN